MEARTLNIPARLDQLPRVAAFIHEAAMALGLDHDVAHAIDLAVDEAFTNIASYAYPPEAPGPVEIRLSRQGDRVTVLLEDQGREFHLKTSHAPDLDSPLEERRIGGLGLFLMEEMMDTVSRTRHGRTNRLEMSKALA